MAFLWEIVRLGLGNLRRHLLRSVLTALGIILGVAAVIANGGIGEGAKRAALEQIERLGAKNIIVRSQQPPDTATQSGQRASFTNRYGLTRADLATFRQQFPQMEAIVPLKEVGGQVMRGPKRLVSQSFGTTPELQRVANLRVARGRYLSQDDVDGAQMVCVIGAEIARVFYARDEDPLDDTIRIDSRALKVVGILEPTGFAAGRGSGAGGSSTGGGGGGGGSNTGQGRDINFDIHLPITTAGDLFGDTIFRVSSGNRSVNAVQVSEIYFTAPDREQVVEFADLIRRAVDVRHPGLTDVTIIVPYELLENARKTARTWQLVLGAIAGISLLVGGIGIMNIMLASVTERTREIGIRRALGATRRHIVYQFVVETGVLSVIGGLLGVGLGIALTLFMGWAARELHKAPLIGSLFPSDVNLPTAVTASSVLIAFFVASLVGIAFGLYPAVKAAKQDPIQALRHD